MMDATAKATRPQVAYLLAVAVAAAMAYVSSRFLFVGSGLNVLPWGALAIAFGAFARNKAQATRQSATYGFAQSFIFLWVDKSGSTSVGQFLLLLIVTFLLGLFGAICGGVLGRAGWLIRARIAS